MIEKIILDYLTSNLNVPVFPERPEHEPERYVLIEKTGSGKKDHINRATIALKTYAESMYEAANLNEIVKEKMEDIINECDISKSELNSDYPFTDVTSKRYRYQAVFDLVY